MSVIDEVKQRTDIVEVVGQYLPLKKAGRNFTALCPFHTEKTPSFIVSPERQSWHCFGACNTGGDAFAFIMRKESIEFGEALRLLADKAGVKIPSSFEPEAGKDERERLYQVNKAAAQYFHNLLLNSPAGKKARSYSANRGFSPETIADFKLGFSLDSWDAFKQYLVERGYAENELVTAGLIAETDDGKTHDRFRNKLMFPILDGRKHIIGFGARVLDDSLPKYINSPQTPIFDKSGSLYGINSAQAAIREQDMAVIVEGYMDVITAHQNGFKNVVASMGTSVTEKQVSALKRLTRNITFALDADAAGEEAMLRGVGYENTLDAEVKVIILPSGEDPDDVIKQDATAWQRLLGEALPVVDYTFDMVASKLDLTTARDKSQVVDKLLPIIAEIKNPIRQAHYLQKLARLINVPEHSLETALSRMRPSHSRRPTRRSEEPKQRMVAQVPHPFLSNPVEEYCLALLLQHLELKTRSHELSPEYFESSENREIFLAYRQGEDVKSIKEKLDTAIWERLDTLLDKGLPSNQIEQKYANCVLNLRKIYLQNLEAKKSDLLALEAETGGTAAELAKLEEQGIEASAQLREVFGQRRPEKPGAKEVKNGLR